MKFFRRYPFKNAYNVRDLGGYPTHDGGITRFGVFYRADSLANLTKEEWQTIEQMHVRTIIDLRSTKEKMSRSYQPTEGIRYFHMPLQDEKQNKGIGSYDQAFEKSMSEAYINLYKDNANNILEIIQTIASSVETGSVLFHCTAGKDRTGIIAALILYLSNVDPVDISADYQITYTYNLRNPIINEVVQIYGNLLKSDPDSIETLILLWETEAPDFINKLTDCALKNIQAHFLKFE